MQRSLPLRLLDQRPPAADGIVLLSTIALALVLPEQQPRTRRGAMVSLQAVEDEADR